MSDDLQSKTVPDGWKITSDGDTSSTTNMWQYGELHERHFVHEVLVSGAWQCPGCHTFYQMSVKSCGCQKRQRITLG
jgi:hypothetical protein